VSIRLVFFSSRYDYHSARWFAPRPTLIISEKQKYHKQFLVIRMRQDIQEPANDRCALSAKREGKIWKYKPIAYNGGCGAGVGTPRPLRMQPEISFASKRQSAKF
jgi:hypothetical protein